MGVLFRRRGMATVLLLALAGTAFFPGRSLGAPGAEKGQSSAPISVTLHDVELLDQDGNKLLFESEVVGDRIVAIDTFYTTCGLICPILSAIFADLQKKLGDRLGREVTLLSFSVDPVTDVPARLKEYAEQWKAKPGWVFLTGEDPNVTRALQGLGLYSPDFTSHPAAFLVGDGKTGKWTRFYGFPSSKKLLAKIDELLAARP